MLDVKTNSIIDRKQQFIKKNIFFLYTAKRAKLEMNAHTIQNIWRQTDITYLHIKMIIGEMFEDLFFFCNDPRTYVNNFP